MSDEGVKTGIFGSIGSGASRRDEYSTADRIGGWAAYKAMWSGHFSKALFLSLLTLVFVIPAIVWVILQDVIGINVGLSAPFNIFDGLGYPGPDIVGEWGMDAAEELGNLLYYNAAVLQYSVLIPCIAVAGVGLGAMAYVARLFMYGEMKVFRPFLRGIACNWASGLIGGALCGAGVFLLMYANYSFTLHGWGMVGRVFAIIGCALLIALLAIYSYYLVNLSSAYKMSFAKKLRDSLLLTFAHFPQNMLACLVAALYVGAMLLLGLLFGSSQMSMLPWVLMFFLGFYGITAAFVAVDQGAFAKYISEGVTERETKLRNEQFYAAKREKKRMMKEAEAAGETVPGAKKQPAHYVNPKKKKSAKSDGGKPRAETVPVEEKPVSGYTADEMKKMEEDRLKVAELASGERKEASGLEDMSVYEDDGE